MKKPTKAAWMATWLCVAFAGIAPASYAADAPAKENLADVTADLNGDGIKDRAVLLHDRDGDNASDVDLAIYLSSNGKLPETPAIYMPAFGYTGDLEGTKPSLALNRAGSLVVVFQNDAIGRSRYRQQYTIAFRNGAFVVAGYDYETRDTVSPDQGGNCDIDFLSGKGTRNGKPVSVAHGTIPLASWTDQSAPAVCNF